MRRERERAHLPGFVDGMIARPEAPCGIAPIVPSVAVRLVVVGGARRKAEVHEVGNGRLALPVAEGAHGE